MPSLLCPYCASAIRLGLDDEDENLHSGDTFRCRQCGHEVVLDVWRTEDRARFYTRAARGQDGDRVSTV